MGFFKLTVFGLLFSFFVISTFAQEKNAIRENYNAFLELEFTSPDSAIQILNNGLNKALEHKKHHLIAEGYKYKSWYYQDIDAYKMALTFTDSSLYYLEKIINDEEKINIYNQKGNLLSDMALLDSSLVWYEKGFLLAKEIDDKQGIAKLANNMALAYTDKGDFIEAINYYHLSIEKSKSINDLQSVGDAYNNLGSLFTQIGDYDQGLDYHWKAYDIRKGINDKKKLSSVVLNIGRIYLAKNQLDSARQQFFTSLNYDLKLNDQSGVALNYNNIGITYLREEELDSAYHYLIKSYDIQKTINDPFGLILTYNNIGEYHIIKGHYEKAIEKCLMAYESSSQNNLPYEKLVSCDCLYKAYEEDNNLIKAYRYLKESMKLREELQSEERKKELTKKELGFVYHYKALEDSVQQAKVLNEKEFKIKSTQIEKEKVEEAKKNQLLLFLIIGLFLVLIGVLIYLQLKRQRKKNEIIRAKNDVILHQKNEIDQSINYAQKIQETSLPSFSLKDLFVDSFLIYLPRDVVSGDFYWLEEKKITGFLFSC